jgi:hypothetical protein
LENELFACGTGLPYFIRDPPDRDFKDFSVGIWGAPTTGLRAALGAFGEFSESINVFI